MGKAGIGQPMLEVGIGTDLTPFEKAMGELRAEIGQLSAAINQSGKSVGRDYTPAIDKAGKQTNEFTGFIREQRQENRMMNFVFRESMGAVSALSFGFLALSSSLSDNNKQVQQINRGFGAMMGAFQGVSFSLQALNLVSGGTAMVIGLIVAVGVGLLSFLSKAETKAKSAEEAMKSFARSLSEQTTQGLQDYRQALLSNIRTLDINIARLERMRAAAALEQGGIYGTVQAIDALAGTTITSYGKIDKALDANKKKRELLVEWLRGVEAEQDEAGERTTKKEREAAQEKIEARKGIISWIEHEIKLLEEQKSKATSLGQIYELNAEIEHKKFQLAMANRGTSLEFEMKYISALKQERDLHFLISKEFQKKLVPTEQVQLISPEQARFGADVINQYIAQQANLREAWMQTHQTVMGALDVMGVGIQTAFGQFLMVHRQAKDEWDTVWIAMRNTAVSILSDIVVQLIKNEIITKAMRAASTAATVASMKIINTAAVPAATAVSIATFGGAALVGTTAMLTSLAATKIAFRLPGLAKGALAYGPMLAVVGDNPGAAFNPEVIAPLSDLRGMGIQRIQVEVIGRVSGRDIVFITDKVRDEIGRIAGN